jgi:hypothetical protein
VKGFRPEILRRVHCFSLFWQALDIIWFAIFTLIYLGKIIMSETPKCFPPACSASPTTFWNCLLTDHKNRLTPIR